MTLVRYGDCGRRAVSILRHNKISLTGTWMLPVVLVWSIQDYDYICHSFDRITMRKLLEGACVQAPLLASFGVGNNNNRDL